MIRKRIVISIGRFCLALAVLLFMTGFVAKEVKAASQIKQVKLKLQDYAPPKGARAESVQWWMEEVTKRSNGKITFDAYWSGSLIPAKEALEAVSTGLADCGMIALAYFTGQLPLHNLGNMPLGAATFEASAYAFRDLYEEFPELKAELTKQGVKALYMQGTPPMQLHFNKPVRNLEDMKGLKVRSYGLSSKMLKAWGAVPIGMPFPEIYEALNLGTIDGTVTYIYAQKPYRHYEVAKYFILGNFGAMPCQPFIINMKTWESLGPAGQQILQEAADEAQRVLIDKFKKQDVECLQLMKDKGVEIYELPPAKRTEWVQKGRSFWNEWMKEMDAKGIPGTKICPRYLELAEKYQKELESRK